MPNIIKKGYLIFKNKVFASDGKNNQIQAEYAEYDEVNKILKTKGTTKVFTSENYTIESEDITLDNKKFLIISNKSSIISDQDKNIITLENFKYLTKENIFKSIGYIKVEDKLNNNYEFSQIYIDTKNKEILGTDIKAFLNQKNLKINKDNKPRVFANTISLNKEKDLLIKVYLHYVITEKMTNVLLGLFKPLKCYMTKKENNLL